MVKQGSRSNLTKVWDPLVRLGHWVLVVAFFTAYVTEDDLLSVHVWAGYTVGAVIVVRIVWGFVGPTHARFRDFLYGPRTTLHYLGELLRVKGQHRYLGHSPAGGAMVVLLLLGLAAATWSGLMVYAYDQQAGPLASFIVSPEAPDDEFKALEEYWEETHEVVVNLTLLLVILHIGGVFLASFVHKENLVHAMFTGRKRSPDQESAR